MSYADELILTQLLWGLKSREFCERVLQRGDKFTKENVHSETLECGRYDNAKLKEEAHDDFAKQGIVAGAKCGINTKGGGV